MLLACKGKKEEAFAIAFGDQLASISPRHLVAMENHSKFYIIEVPCLFPYLTFVSRNEI
jgi:hypothetical protein